MDSRHGIGEEASTGISELDAALGGLYWGDNVVWDAHGEVTARPTAICRAGEAQQSLAATAAPPEGDRR